VVAVGSYATGAIEVLGDSDWFRVDLVGGRSYTISLEGSFTGWGTLKDPVALVKSAAGTGLATFDDGGVGTNALGSFTAPISGTYFIEATSFASASQSMVGSYRLWVSDSATHGFGLTAAGQAFQTSVLDVLRWPGGSVVPMLITQVNSGQLSAATALPQIVREAASTSSVATLSYQFFTGSTPSAAGMDYLLSPKGINSNNLNSDYYQSFSLENRYINFSVNLGKFGSWSGFISSYIRRAYSGGVDNQGLYGNFWCGSVFCKGKCASQWFGC